MFVQTLLATHRWWENSSPSFFHPIKLLFLVAPRAHSPPGGQQPQLCVRRAPPAALPPGPAAALWLFLVNTSLQFIDSLLEKQHYIISFSLKNTFFFFFFCKTNRQHQQEQQQNAITFQLKCAASFLPCEDTAQSHTGIDAEQPPPTRSEIPGLEE